MVVSQPKTRHVADAGKERQLGALLMTIIFYPLMFVWSVAGFITSPLVYLIVRAVTGWRTGRVIRFIIWLHGRGMIAIVSPFISLKRSALDSIPRPSIMVVNHLSFFDGYFMAALPFHDMAFAVGAWPFKMFWYTLFMRLANYLDVENSSWEDTLKSCRDIFATGAGVLFFPEGHRSRTGRLQQFQSGAFRLAVETGMPVVPLCITGTDLLMPPGRYWLHPAAIRLKALPAVDPAPFAGTAGQMKLRKHVQDLMAAELAQMGDNHD